MSRGEASGPFRVGDRVQLTGPKGRLHTITLEPGKVFHSHKGPIAHDDLIGLPDGSVVANAVGVEYLALRPPAVTGPSSTCSSRAATSTSPSRIRSRT